MKLPCLDASYAFSRRYGKKAIFQGVVEEIAAVTLDIWLLEPIGWEIPKNFSDRHCNTNASR